MCVLGHQGLSNGTQVRDIRMSIYEEKNQCAARGRGTSKKRKVLPNVERKANGRLLVLHGQEVSNNCMYAGYRGYCGDDTRIRDGKKIIVISKHT